MADYLPSVWLKPSTLPSATGPSFFRSMKAGDGNFIVTGGDDPQAIFIDGEHFGKAFRAKGGSSRGGICISDIEVHADPDSIFSSEREGMRLGALALTSEGFFIFAGSRAQFGFDDTFAWNIDTGVALEYVSGAMGFAKWRLCRRDGERIITLADVEAAAGR